MPRSFPSPRPFAALLLALISTAFAADATQASTDDRVVSPDGRLAAIFRLDAAGVPRYAIELDGHPVLTESRLGLVRDDADFSTGLRLLAAPTAEPVSDRYEILTAKRRVNTYAANRRVFHLQNAAGQGLEILFQVSNDGVAFRYRFPETDTIVRHLTAEATSFRFRPGTRAWLQPMSVAKSGWAKANPAYEEYYQKDVPVGTPSTTGAGWVYPALFRSDDIWLLVSEAGLGRTYCGTRLRPEVTDGEYSVGFPDPREGRGNGAVNPESTLPWQTPWRLIVVGSLQTVAESTLGLDLADPPTRSIGTDIAPGKASWSWPLLGDKQTTYDVQKRFVDYAADMGWRYCLVDALWDKQIGYERMKELADYARGKGIGILVWYNSAGDWNTTPQTPRDMLLTPESRAREFARLKTMGIAGLKIDFFGGDGQSMIGYYLDLLEDSAPYGLLLNFHGATLPRGWSRTYPHLMTMESIRGLEYITFAQANADEEPSHAAMLPFTRNVFDPMDFTPVVLDRLPRTQRRTSSAFELALAVLFTSGIQHYAEIPDGMAKAPAAVRDFLKTVPSVWDDTKFLAGDPGRYVVLARKGGNRWYLSGINAEETGRKLALDLRSLSLRGTGKLLTDGDGSNLSFREEAVRLPADGKLEVTLRARGGFVAVFE